MKSLFMTHTHSLSRHQEEEVVQTQRILPSCLLASCLLLPSCRALENKCLVCVCVCAIPSSLCLLLPCMCAAAASTEARGREDWLFVVRIKERERRSLTTSHGDRAGKESRAKGGRRTGYEGSKGHDDEGLGGVQEELSVGATVS